MAQSVTPSTQAATTTEGQISKAIANYRAMLEKHAPEFSLEAVQQVLGDEDFAAEQLAVFRKRVEMLSNLIIRRVPVNRTRSPQEMLDATGRAQYTDKKVVAAMPKGDGAEAEVAFFKLDLKGGYISDVDLDKEYELHGLKPVDPYSLGAVNEADPAFADEHPNATHWKDAQGKYCCAIFCRWRGGRELSVRRNDNAWNDGWFFAGVRK